MKDVYRKRIIHGKDWRYYWEDNEYTNDLARSLMENAVLQ
jgi:hypothetical protein